MRHLLTAIILLILTLPLMADDESADTKDQTVQGTWVLQSAIAEGSTVLTKGAAEITLGKETYLTRMGGNVVDKGTYIENKKQKPWRMDLMSKQLDGKLQAIYKLEKGQLIVCYAIGKDTMRPKAFDAGRPGVVLITYKRK